MVWIYLSATLTVGIGAFVLGFIAGAEAMLPKRPHYYKYMGRGFEWN
jgi:hypothetical protein